MPEDTTGKHVKDIIKPIPPISIFTLFEAEEREDRRNFILAFFCALTLHLMCFPVLTEWTWTSAAPSSSAAPAGGIQKRFVVQEQRFAPLKPRPEESLRKSKKVPIPDSTPDDAESIITDIVFGIPDPPPVFTVQGPIRVEPPASAIRGAGGAAEPGAPYGDALFRDYGTNPFIDTGDDRFSTFGLDVDTGSYTVARRFLTDGYLPPPDAVRVEEFVNYFDYGESPPEEGDFAIYAEGSSTPFGEDARDYLLRFHIRGRDVDDDARPPADLVFVVDVSGSMAGEGRLGLVKKSLHLLLEAMRPDDRIGLVVYGSEGRVLIESTDDHGALRGAIDALRTEGSTNAEDGLRLGYEVVARHRRPGAIPRVILCSDGVANVGRTSADSIFEVIRRHAEDGIELTTVGFGMGNYNDVLMERLADIGNGRYAYVDDLREARRIFVEDLTGTLQTIAAEARVQVEFRADVVARYRLLGFENRAIADESFRDDSVDAGEIGAGHAVTALYEVRFHSAPARRDEIARISLRYGSVAERDIVEVARSVTGEDLSFDWHRSSRSFRLAGLVAEFAELLRGSVWAAQGDLDDVFRRLQTVSAEFPDDREVAELVHLVELAADLRHQES